MKLTSEDVKHIAALARLGLDEEETKRMEDQLSKILENFEILGEVDTDAAMPTAHILEVDSVVRDDEVTPSLSQSEVLANAPREEQGFFRVRAVLE